MNLLLAGELDAAERADWVAALRLALPDHRLCLARGEVADASIGAAIVANPAPGSLAGLSGLRLIQSLWAGVDRLLTDPTLPAEVPLARMVDPAMNSAMAETALWAALALQRGFFEYARHQQASRWQPHGQRRADESPALVLGCGEMGRAVAGRLLQQGYPVSAWRRGAAAAAEAVPAGVRVLSGAPALFDALAQAQILINLLPLTPDTRGLIDARMLAALPRGAGLVNLARGAHLVAALASGQIGHAVLDVFQVEPLPAGHAFWLHPQVTVLPHAAAMTDVRSAAAVVAGNLEALAAGLPLRHLVARDTGY